MAYRDKDVMREKARQYYLANKERLREKYLANSDAKKEKSRRYYRENKEVRLQKNREWRSENKERLSEYRVSNKEHIKEQSHEYYRLHKDSILERNRAFHSVNKHVRKEQHLKRKYGVTLKQWDELFVEQGKCCAICKTTNATWDLDHCHASGQVRAVLCHSCNVLLGAAKEDTKVLEKAIEYLIHFAARDERKVA